MNLKVWRAAGPILLALLAASAVIAKAPASVLESLKQATKSAVSGSPAETVNALEDALRLARKGAPLELRKVVAVERPAKGLGVYDPLKGPIEFRTLWLYVEVANYATTPVGDQSELRLVVEAEFFDKEGSIGSKPLGRHVVKTRTDVGVSHFGLDVRLGTTAPKGAYELELKVTDELSKKSAKKRLKFTI